MSRNNVILVARVRGRYFVLPRLNADTQWNAEYVRQRAEMAGQLSTLSRARALVLAHNMQARMQCEHGVREINVDTGD